MIGPTNRAEQVSVGASIAVRNVVKRYRSGRSETAALAGVNLEVAAGEAVALMGPSGSGKSTLLHLVGAMDAPSSGSIFVGRVNVGDLRGEQAATYRRTVGFVFQAFHLLGGLSALDNVLAPLFPLGLARAREPEARSLLASVGLEDRVSASPSQLSGGEQQRVALARAMIVRPALILADEPTGSLDSATGHDVVELLLSLRADHGTTLLVATHNGDLARRLDRVVTLVDGKTS